MKQVKTLLLALMTLVGTMGVPTAHASTPIEKQICNGGHTTLSYSQLSGRNRTLEWHQGSADGQLLGTTATLTVAPNVTTNYYLIITDTTTNTSEQQTFVVTVNQTYEQTPTVITVCDSLQWNSVTYTTTGTYTAHLSSIKGCDSVVHQNIIVKHSTHKTLSQAACDNYTWNGHTYNQSGTYNHTSTNAASCDSTTSLILTINQSSSSSETKVACASLTWNGTTYNNSGNFTTTIPNAKGCDSTIALNLTINPTYETSETQTACDSYTWANGTGQTYTSSADITARLQSAKGCDSTITLHLTVKHATFGDTTAIACNSFIWYGTNHTVTPATAPTHLLPNANSAGCDSTVRLHLTVNHSSSSETSLSACDSYTWQGTNRTSTGIYRDTIPNAKGCDSAMTLALTIHPSYHITDNQTACDSYTWPVNGITYTSSTATPVTLSSHHACDSTITLVLNVNKSTTSDTAATACGSFTWYGITYTSTPTTTPTRTTTNAAGCDSTIRLHLIVNQPTSSSTTQTACDSYLWRGNSYTSSGTYTETIPNAKGCDSTMTLTLTIHPSRTTTVDQTVCDSYVWPATGQTYTSSADLVATLQTSKGCDSTVTLHLTVNRSTTSDTTATACASFVWHGTTFTQTPTQTPTYTTTNAAGCDSTIQLHLTIYSYDMPEVKELVTKKVPGSSTPLLLIYPRSDNEPDHLYQWYKDGVAINSASEQYYRLPPAERNPQSATTYSVLVSSQEMPLCASTSQVTLFPQNATNANLTLWPNPARETVSYHLEGEHPSRIDILNRNGELVLTNMVSDDARIDVGALPAGVYFVVVHDTNGNSHASQLIIMNN